MKLAWIVVCQRALLDQNNNISLIQVLEEIGVPARPEGSGSINALIPFPCAVVALLCRSVADEPESAQARTRILGPDGREIAKLEASIDMTKAKRNRWIAQLPGIPYRGSGIYVATVEVAVGKRWRRVGSAEFMLHHNMNAPSANSKKTASEPTPSSVDRGQG